MLLHCPFLHIKTESTKCKQKKCYYKCLLLSYLYLISCNLLLRFKNLAYSSYLYTLDQEGDILEL